MSDIPSLLVASSLFFLLAFFFPFVHFALSCISFLVCFVRVFSGQNLCPVRSGNARCLYKSSPPACFSLFSQSSGLFCHFSVLFLVIYMLLYFRLSEVGGFRAGEETEFILGPLGVVFWGSQSWIWSMKCTKMVWRAQPPATQHISFVE